MNNIYAVDAALVPVVVGLVQVVKMLGLSSRFAFLASLLFGLGAAFLLQGDSTWQITVFHGVLTGLSASGLYSGPKAMTENSY